jgi:hypothetical protein
VHGRALHRHLNLSSPLKFAHQPGEIIIQLPESFTRARAAPGLQHLAGDKAVHRQYEIDEDENSPLAILQRARRPSPPPMPPSPPPSPPSPPFLPPPRQEIFALEDQLYGYDPENPLAYLPIGASLEGGGTSKSANQTDAHAYQAAKLAASPAAASRFHALAEALRSATVSTASTVGAKDIASTFAAVPVWVWPTIGGVLLLSVAICLFYCWRSSQKRKKRAAKLEDINPVFQTETWSKDE